MKLNAFTKSYENRIVLSFPGIELPEGGICAIIGSNGSGKSTLARVLSGVISAAGSTSPLSPNIRVGYMPQNSFAFRMSTQANLRLSGGDEAKAKELMERLQISHLAKQQAKKLSGGETSRMALARLLMQRYDLLILDEPTASMDMESTALTEAVVKDYCRATGCTVLWVTHSLQQARRVADYALFLYRGALCEADSADKLLFTPKEAETQKFLEFCGL